MRDKVIISVILLVSAALPLYAQQSVAAGKGGAGVWRVEDFGAKGDGVTDDTAAIQKALDEAGKTGGEVKLAPAKYLVSGSLKIPVGVALTGSARPALYRAADWDGRAGDWRAR
jgi:hypothetical protein